MKFNSEISKALISAMLARSRLVEIGVFTAYLGNGESNETNPNSTRLLIWL